MTTITKYKSVPKLGKGIFTISDVGRILGLPNSRVRRWIKEYWDFKLGKSDYQYSWTDGKNTAIDFHTLIELYVFSELRKANVKITDIVLAHLLLSKDFNTPFPFANKRVIESLSTDGYKIYFKYNKSDILTLDGTEQFNLALVKLFFKKVEFNGEIVSKLFPLGKRCRVVVDPTIKMGLPVVQGTGITVDSIYDLYNSGESISMISYLYNMDAKSVKDAIKYCKSAA